MPPFHKNSIPTWFVENNQCCLHLNCRKHSVLRQYTTHELRKTISYILSWNLVTKHFIKSLLSIFNFFSLFLRVFNLVQFPVLIVPALFLQGTYLEAVSGLHCFIFLARLNMKEQVIIINCCNINFIIILISSEKKKKQQQQQQNKQTRTSISVSI